MIDERESIEHNVKLVVDFMEQETERVDTQVLRNSFILNTPEYTVDLILDHNDN